MIATVRAPAAPLRRLVGVLPPGTLAVGAGLGVLGAASYVHLAVAGHTLAPADMSAISVLWSIVFAIGPGLFLPIEQEITRIVAARRVHAEAAGPVLRRGATLAAAIFAGLLVLLLAGGGPMADRLFAGRHDLVWVLVGALGALAMAHTTRGVLAGLGHFGWYGAQLGADGLLRMVMASLLGVFGVTSSAWFGLVLVLAPVASVLLTLAPVLRVPAAGLGIRWSELCRGLGLLMVSALLAQVVANIAVINVRLLDPGDVVVAGALLSALVLVRVPVFVFASLQASLLPGLAAAVAGGDLAGYRRMLVRALAVVTALAVAVGVVIIPLGPWLVRLLFDAPDVLGRADFAWLAAGTCAWLWTMVLGQGAQARNRHRDQAAAWVIGTAVLVAVTMLPGGVAQRVELAYTVGSVTVVAALAYALARRRAAARRPTASGARRPTA